MWGDQWICGNCGFHNFILRKKCRNCELEKEKASVGEEEWFEVMATSSTCNEGKPPQPRKY